MVDWSGLRIQDVTVPQPVRDLLAKSGYDELYPPQEEAIRAGVLDGKNTVLASPTASGKTLVAELAILKTILSEAGKALYLTPLRALASEKFADFRKYESLEKPDGRRIRVAITTGDYDGADPFLGTYDIVICTNEKADSLLRHRAKWISQVALVVADEIHLLTEPDRGPTLEVVLTRLRSLNPRLQFLALSATIRNAQEIGEWLGAFPITTEWRPVPLKEGVHCLGQIQFKDGSSRIVPDHDKSPVMSIALDVVENSGQVLVFTETRRAAVDMAKRAAFVLRRARPKDARKINEAIAQRILAAAERTRLSELLSQLVANGAAFHHAGLPTPHRAIIEDAFRAGHIKILTATPTLAAGVNLPARTVIISSYQRYEPGFGRYPISVLEYKQFCGRAGRPRYDPYGEAILVAQSEDERDALFRDYVTAQPERLWSKLGVERVLRPHVLATIATGFAHTEQGLDEFFSKTFYAHQYGARVIRNKLGEILQFLAKENMIQISGPELEATNFGRRVSELYIDPMSAVILRDGLYNRARKLTEFSFLHLISRTPDIAPRLYTRRGEDDVLDAYAREHSEEFMCEIPDLLGDSLGLGYDEFLAEVKTARVMQDWTNEITEDGILNAHKVEPGDLLRLTDMADWLLYATHELARLFGHHDLFRPVGELRIRIDKGIKSELIPLVRLDGVGRVRARVLYNAGYKDLQDLKAVSVTDLMQLPTIGPRLAKKIKEQAGGVIKSKEWEMLKAQPDESQEQSLLTDY